MKTRYEYVPGNLRVSVSSEEGWDLGLVRHMMGHIEVWAGTHHVPIKHWKWCQVVRVL